MLGKIPAQESDILKVEDQLSVLQIKDIETPKIDNSDKQVAINIPDVSTSVQSKKASPRRLSWSEWLASFGPAFKDYWTNDPLRWQMPALMFTAGALCTFAADPDGQMQAVKNLTVPAIFSSLIIQYLRYFIVNAAHESGHAAAHYLVSGEIADIYLGSEAADGVEILPHMILAGVAPSRGQSTNIGNPMLSDALLQDNLLQVFKTFQAQYPKKTVSELLALPAFQQACNGAYSKSEIKTVQGRLKYFAVVIAGVVSGLITNGLVKLGMGESITSIDHIDMVQLFNLFPADGFDGGVIANSVFDLPKVAEVGRDIAVPAAFAMLFLKALTELNAKDPSKNTFHTIVHACGLALMNFSTNGFLHISGN